MFCKADPCNRELVIQGRRRRLPCRAIVAGQRRPGRSTGQGATNPAIQNQFPRSSDRRLFLSDFRSQGKSRYLSEGEIGTLQRAILDDGAGAPSRRAQFSTRLIFENIFLSQAGPRLTSDLRRRN